MKRYIVLVMALVSSALHGAATGSALISPIEVTHPTSPIELLNQLYLTNITNEIIDVKLSLITGENGSGLPVYYTDGNNSAATGPLRAEGGFQNYTETGSGASASVQILPLSTMKFVITAPSVASTQYFMFGKVEWSAPSNVSAALLGRLLSQHNDAGSSGIASVALNQGAPF